MAKDKEKDVLTAGEPKNVESEGGINKEVGAEIVTEEEVNDENVKDSEEVVPGVVETVEAEASSETPKSKIGVKELTAFVRYLAERTLGSAELDTVKQCFKDIFED